jgi:hypothetical protein
MGEVCRERFLNHDIGRHGSTLALLREMATIIYSILSAAVAGVLAWLATNWIGEPISAARNKRIKALQAAEQNSHIGGAAGAERIAAAKAALNDAASALRSISRGHQWPVRLYCRFVRYDLEAAASGLIRLHNMTGDHGYDDKARQLALDAIYVFLGAHRLVGK